MIGFGSSPASRGVVRETDRFSARTCHHTFVLEPCIPAVQDTRAAKQRPRNPHGHESSEPFSGHVGPTGCLWAVLRKRGLLRTFGERQIMAQLITRRSFVSPLINKDFRACHPLLARDNFSSVHLNHQKCVRPKRGLILRSSGLGQSYLLTRCSSFLVVSLNCLDGCPRLVETSGRIPAACPERQPGPDRTGVLGSSRHEL
jgi:hypothetical protein